MARITIKVVPGSSQDKIVGWLGDALKVRVRAQPEKGKANTAVIALLAKALGVSIKDVQVFSGHTSSTKIIDIAGDSEASLRAKISQFST